MGICCRLKQPILDEARALGEHSDGQSTQAGHDSLNHAANGKVIEDSGRRWPDSRQRIKENLGGFSEAIQRKITLENVSKLYGIG